MIAPPPPGRRASPAATMHALQVHVTAKQLRSPSQSIAEVFCPLGIAVFFSVAFAALPRRFLWDRDGEKDIRGRAAGPRWYVREGDGGSVFETNVSFASDTSRRPRALTTWRAPAGQSVRCRSLHRRLRASACVWESLGRPYRPPRPLEATRPLVARCGLAQPRPLSQTASPSFPGFKQGCNRAASGRLAAVRNPSRSPSPSPQVP